MQGAEGPFAAPLSLVPCSKVEKSLSVLVEEKLPACWREPVLALNSPVSLTALRGPTKPPMLSLFQTIVGGMGGRIYGVLVIWLGRHSSFDPPFV